MPTVLNPTQAAEEQSTRYRSLSVVVTITTGASHIDRCLDALERQLDLPPTEILVPVHPALDDVAGLEKRHPKVRFIPVTDVEPVSGASNAGQAHLVYDRRRTTGLLAAAGDIVAITEDHAIPGPRWCARILDLHNRLPHGAIGGAINNRSTYSLSRAIYYCDFGRYQNPVPEGPATYISDVNVSYKRNALEAVRDSWSLLFHEIAVHQSITENGDTLYLSALPEVLYDRGPLSLGRTLRERFAWGRLFAGRRARTVSPPRRLMLLVGSPALPFLLTLRKFISALTRRTPLAPFFSALPAIFLLSCAWAAGEFAGYLTAQAVPGSDF